MDELKNNDDEKGKSIQDSEGKKQGPPIKSFNEALSEAFEAMKLRTIPQRYKRVFESDERNYKRMLLKFQSEIKLSTQRILINQEKPVVILKDFRMLFHESKCINMKTLSELNKTFIKDKRVHQSLEGKIYAVLHRGGNIIFKNYYDQETREPRRSFFELVTDRKDFRKPNSLTARAARAGNFLCAAVLDLMFFLSMNKRNETRAKFQAFEDTLGWVSRDQNTVVIRRVLDLIKLVENKLREKHSNMADKMKARGDDDLKESFVDPLMFQLIKQIFEVELFWVYKRLPCARSLLMGELPLLENELTKYKVSVMKVEDEINAAVHAGYFGEFVMYRSERVDHKDLQSKNNMLWDDSDELCCAPNWFPM